MTEKVYMEKSTWIDILNALREKSGGTGELVAGEVAAAIRALPTYDTEALTTYANGEYAPPPGVAYNAVTVDVSDSIIPRSLPEDGKTYIGYVVPEETPEHIRTATICFSQTIANGVVLDWGDGSPPETFSNSGNQTATHDYAETGREYIISLRAVSGTMSFGGSSTRSICGNTYTTGTGSVAYNRGRVKWVVFGDNVSRIGTYALYCLHAVEEVRFPSGLTSLANYICAACYSLHKVDLPAQLTSIPYSGFSQCYSLRDISIPSGVTSIDGYAFDDCRSLIDISIPSGVTSIGTYSFRNCCSLQKIIVPVGVTSIPAYCFATNSSLVSFTVPRGVTSIGNYAFQYPLSLNRLRIEPTTPPTVGNGVFSSLPTTCIISVPRGTLSDYTSAANYPDPNTYTYIEEG